MGVHVNLATQSGTNDLHGAVFEFVRNSLFDAHPFFDTPGSPQKPLHINQFGGEVGGPVYLPRLYNGRNKTFFMASYEGLRQIKSPSQLGTTFSRSEERRVGKEYRFGLSKTLRTENINSKQLRKRKMAMA